MSRKEKLKNLQHLTIAEVMELAGERDSFLGICTIKTYKQLKNGFKREYKDSLECIPMDAEWKEAIKEKWWAKVNWGKLSKENSQYKKFMKNLLQFAGEEVCFQLGDSDFPEIQAYGQFWFGKNAKLMVGAPSRCHENSYYLWKENQENTLICTGYALSEDGMWRQHSWLVNLRARSNQIIETTSPRVAYFGVCLPFKSCQEFLSW